MKKPAVFTFFGSQLSAQQHLLHTLPAAFQEWGWAGSGSLGQPPGHGKGGTEQQGREGTEAPERQSHCSQLLCEPPGKEKGRWADGVLKPNTSRARRRPRGQGDSSVMGAAAVPKVRRARWLPARALGTSTAPAHLPRWAWHKPTAGQQRLTPVPAVRPSAALKLQFLSHEL